ncbi:MAG: carbon storage regulator [Acidobacteriota bacterium]
MLVIRRRMGESLVIGGDIEVEVLEFNGSQVKLGIRAPKAIPVVRKEILVVGTQNQAAARFISRTSARELLEKLKTSSPTPISAL